jgi:hypothetical protein
MSDARIVVYDSYENQKYTLNQPLSKYPDDTDIIVLCEFPFKVTILSTCKIVMDLINEAKIMYSNKTLDAFISRIKLELEKPYDPNNLDFDMDVLLYEITHRAKKSVVNNEITDILVAKPPYDNKMCNFCGGRANLRCGSCNMSFYCNRECQLSDWKSCHKGICKMYRRHLFMSVDKVISFN